MSNTPRPGAEHPDAPAYIPNPANPNVRGITALFSGTGMVLFTLFITTGVIMRMAQAGWIDISPSWFYRMLTMHGAGMLVAMMLAMMGAMYYAISGSLFVEKAAMVTAWAFAVIGGVVAIVSIMIGNFAGAWTFLYPLPLSAAAGWTKWSAVVFLIALVFVALSWGIYMIELLYRLSTSGGGLYHTSGLKYLFGKDDNPPSPSIVAATTVVIAGLLANLPGMIIVAAQLVQSMNPAASFDALWAKNLTYFYGHSVMNLLIYMAAALIYMLVPRYTGRQWKINKIIVLAWLGVFAAVMGAYSHHLYLDFVQPKLANEVSQILSSVAVLPLALVTGYSGVILVWGSKFRWTMASAFLYLGFVGWFTGGIGALIDSLIHVNSSFHNTVWVPAHFHGYLLMGVMFWGMSMVAHLLERSAGRPASKLLTWVGIGLIMVGGYTLTTAWYFAGAMGVPRRWAIQPEGSHPTAVVGSIGALLLSAGVLVVMAAFVHLLMLRQQRIASGAPIDIKGSPELPVTVDNARELLRTPGAIMPLGIAAIVLFLFAFSPPFAGTFGDKGLQEHHVVHTIQFAAGCLIGLWLAARSFSLVRGMSIAYAAFIVLLGQMIMMLAMAPASYKSVENSTGLHILLHLGFTAIGIFVGLHAARFSRGPAWFVTVLGVTAGLFWAVGSLT